MESASRDRGAVSSVRVDLDGVDEPVGVLEGGRVAGDVVLAGGGLGAADGIVGPNLTGPVSAEGRVEDDLVVLEVARDVAAAAGERGLGRAPAARVGGARGDVLGNGTRAREKEDVDG